MEPCPPCPSSASLRFAGAFTLRQRMLNFVQNIQYYMMFEVMEPTWHILEKNLKSASNIDDVLGHHTGFLDTCLKDCMLTNPELLKVFSKLMSVCVMFTNCMQVCGRARHGQHGDGRCGHGCADRGRTQPAIPFPAPASVEEPTVISVFPGLLVFLASWLSPRAPALEAWEGPSSSGTIPQPPWCWCLSRASSDGLSCSSSALELFNSVKYLRALVTSSYPVVMPPRDTGVFLQPQATAETLRVMYPQDSSFLQSVVVKFTQSMKLDSELGGQTLEHGTIPGLPAGAEERVRKELPRKVRGLQGQPVRDGASWLGRQPERVDERRTDLPRYFRVPWD
ncbi:hypothetical protein P7K49_024806 [Saguinus oedipus]|uniref:Gamma-tubulin complex component n=1 Tax=Saguinus oedipus TaxID=9490 RepID=A0ABQ9URB5_SAGOE|nr:hypothetical protein P7K49_024806 [Saguinus oedipus]